MVVFSKQITLLIHIIIHTNGTIKKQNSSYYILEKIIPALHGAEKKCLTLKTCNGRSLRSCQTTYDTWCDHKVPDYRFPFRYTCTSRDH